MILESEDIIEQPVDVVYNTVKNDLANLVPFFPNIEKIIQEKSVATKKGVKITNRWYAKAELPMILKKILKPEFLSWIDRAEWDDNKMQVVYELESPVGKSLYDAKGINTFEDAGKGRTRLKVSCEIELHPENVPGVPTFLASKVTPAVEALLKKILEPNLTSLAVGLKGYYQKKS